jgi:hypothetical protein
MENMMAWLELHDHGQQQTAAILRDGFVGTKNNMF